MVVVTSPQTGLNTMQDLIARAKAKPGDISYGTSGHAGSTHLAGAMLENFTGTKMINVPFKGNAPALAEVMAGRVTFMFYPAVGIADQVAQKRLKVLAVGTAQPWSDFPGVPTLEEMGLRGFDATAPWVGLLAPAGTPPPIVNRMSAEMRRSLARLETRGRIKQLGATNLARTNVGRAEPDLRGGQALRRRLLHECEGLGRLPLPAVHRIEIRKPVLRGCDPLVGRPRPPLDRELGLLRVEAAARHVEVREVGLRLGVALLGCLARQGDRLALVLLDLRGAPRVQACQHELGFRIAIVREAAEPLNRPLVAAARLAENNAAFLPRQPARGEAFRARRLLADGELAAEGRELREVLRAHVGQMDIDPHAVVHRVCRPMPLHEVAELGGELHYRERAGIEEALVPRLRVPGTGIRPELPATGITRVALGRRLALERGAQVAAGVGQHVIELPAVACAALLLEHPSRAGKAQLPRRIGHRDRRRFLARAHIRVRERSRGQNGNGCCANPHGPPVT